MPAPHASTLAIAEFQLAMDRPGLSKDAQAEIATEFLQTMSELPEPRWASNPGPQAAAYVSAADELYFGGSAGPGKAESLDSVALTPFGWKRFGDLKVGTKLCATDGTVTSVIAIHPQGLKDLYRVTMRDGGSVECCEDHLWLAWKTHASRKIKNRMTAGADGARKYTTAAIRAELARGYRSDGRKFAFAIPVPEPVAFNVAGQYCGRGNFISRPIDPYLLGLLIGDGCYTDKTTTSLSSADPEIRGYLVALLGDGVRVRKTRGAADSFHLRGDTLKRVDAHLAALGMLGKRAATKSIPRQYLLAPVADRWALAQGLMDTDGWAEANDSACYCTVSPSLRDDFVFLVRSLGGIAYVTNKIPNYTHNGERRQGQRAFVVRVRIDQPERLFRLPRKREVASTIHHQSEGRFIESVEFSRRAEAMCITVAHPNSLYITDDYIVTHNSALLLGLSLTAHSKSLILRLHGTDLAELKDQLLGQLRPGDAWKQIGHGGELWTYDRRKVEMLGCDDEKRASSLQGRPHDLKCVGRGTPILMADGTYTAIEAVRPGDVVMTLVGPRRVSRRLHMGVKQCWRIRAGGVETVIADDHRVLGEDAWVSPRDLISRRSRVGDNTFAASLGTRPESRTPGWMSRGGSRPIPWPLPQTRPGSRCPARCASPADDQTDAAGCRGSPRAVWRPPTLSVPLVLHVPDPRRAESCSPPGDRGREGVSGRPRPSVPGWQSGCRAGSGFCGGPPRRLSTTAPGSTPSPAGAGEPACCASRSGDGLGRTRSRTRCRLVFRHPYTTAWVAGSEPVRVREAEMAPAGEAEVFDLTVESAAHYISAGGLVHSNCWDEIPQYKESVFRRVNAWNRTTVPGQRCRVVGAGNPPLKAEEEWVIRYFGPWLDEQHPQYPVAPGELRWYAVVDGREEMVADGQPFKATYKNREELIQPLSRTFIPALLEHNPDFTETNYRARLQGLPEPMRSQLLYGDMQIGRSDDANQLLPTAWVRQSMRAWTAEGAKGVPASAASLDCARGGADKMALAHRHGDWVSEVRTWPGVQVPDGPAAVVKFMPHLANLRAPLLVDVVGIGSGVVDTLKTAQLKLRVVPVHFGTASTYRDRSGLLQMANLRAEAYWRLREALDPANGGSLLLPNDPGLMSELCAFHFSTSGFKVKIEDKDDIHKRLGRSPDCFVAGTQITTAGGQVAIEKVRLGDRVLTRDGWRMVIGVGKTDHDAETVVATFSDGRTLRGTGNHPIFVVGRGWVPMDSLTMLDIVEVCSDATLSSTTASNSFDSRTRNQNPRNGITTHSQKAAELRALGRYTKSCGERRTGRYQAATRSTTRMEIRSTTTLTTWNASRRQIIEGGTRDVRQLSGNALTGYVLLLPSGTEAQMDWRGTPSMAGWYGRRGRQKSESATNAARLTTTREFEARASFALPSASTAGTTRKEHTSSTGHAQDAASRSLLCAVASRRTAVHVLGVSAAKNAVVYNLTVDGTHEYYANGILVHNCADAVAMLMLADRGASGGWLAPERPATDKGGYFGTDGRAGGYLGGAGGFMGVG